jgi:hypothetical protein
MNQSTRPKYCAVQDTALYNQRWASISGSTVRYDILRSQIAFVRVFRFSSSEEWATSIVVDPDPALHDPRQIERWNLDSDPQLHQSDEWDRDPHPDPHQSDKLNPDTHHVADDKPTFVKYEPI